RLEAQAARLGWARMHERLRLVDPVTAARIEPGDPQRIQRALEVYELTGQPLSTLQGRRRMRSSDWRYCKLALMPGDRAWLHRRIAIRFERMIEQGLIDEVRRLLELPGMSVSLPAMRAVGYRQVIGHLRGEMGLEEMTERAVIATRQLARRQLTWLRGETDLEVLDPCRSELQCHVLARLAAELEAQR
ncbi:MAG: tRNA (adenosine(37)-N6)-dimethylallyltransferase MiaA, partial [Gammaproteobacteria bacterium]|nr:tRNA (adenosine(37)-N6)-dimethylallyltransferase MiaA [Gammaproteobacteria bacterium]